MVSHYARHGRTTLCGRTVKRAALVREFGEVSCSQCSRQIRVAGFRALGFSKAASRQMARSQ